MTRRHLTLIFSSFFGHSSDRDARFGTYQSYILSNKSQVFLCRAGIGGKAHGGLGGGGGGVLVRLFLIIFAEIIKSETFVDHLRKNPLKYQISCFIEYHPISRFNVGILRTLFSFLGFKQKD